jgi:A/G-specific adenine glycosylase
VKLYPENVKVIDEEKIHYFQNELLNWYEKNGRDFPWRQKSASNYELIISEIFLQRTKAETVAKFLPNFLKKYHNWEKLSKATEFELQADLEQIGLQKQRGSRLFKLAQTLKARNGVFPETRNEIEEIPMMGQYITNAYELYILKKKRPLLDVNMARLLERFFGKRQMVDIRYDPYLQTLAYRIVNIDWPININWAVLDFAAIVCKKKKPVCHRCPLCQKCNYFIQEK